MMEGRCRIFIQLLLQAMQASPIRTVAEVQSFFQPLEGIISLSNANKKSKLLQKIIFTNKQNKDAIPIKGFMGERV
jgi:hypothetical protein